MEIPPVVPSRLATTVVEVGFVFLEIYNTIWLILISFLLTEPEWISSFCDVRLMYLKAPDLIPKGLRRMREKVRNPQTSLQTSNAVLPGRGTTLWCKWHGFLSGFLLLVISRLMYPKSLPLVRFLPYGRSSTKGDRSSRVAAPLCAYEKDL